MYIVRPYIGESSFTIQRNHLNKPSKQTKQTKHRARHPHYPAPVLTSGQPKNQTEASKQARARPRPNQRESNGNQTITKRKSNENQTKTKRSPSSNQAATKTKRVSIHHLEPSMLQTLTNTIVKTAQRTAISKQGCR
jgi:hypothetical protein